MICSFSPTIEGSPLRAAGLPGASPRRAVAYVSAAMAHCYPQGGCQMKYGMRRTDGQRVAAPDGAYMPLETHLSPGSLRWRSLE
jgi:hypothetical protein